MSPPLGKRRPARAARAEGGPVGDTEGDARYQGWPWNFAIAALYIAETFPRIGGGKGLCIEIVLYEFD
jgi:hypothetical protein